MAPPSPKARDQSLPPILRRTHPSPRLGCSKGARGLSVLMRETGIFTGTTDSQCPSLRQCPDRCAIRAGRNLPDKEFRSLLLLHVSRRGDWSFLPASACRHAGRTLPWLAAVHHRCDVSDLLDTFQVEMLAFLHQEEHVTKLQKVDVLLCLQAVLHEERNDSLE